MSQHIMPTWRTVSLAKITFEDMTRWVARLSVGSGLGHLACGNASLSCPPLADPAAGLHRLALGRGQPCAYATSTSTAAASMSGAPSPTSAPRHPGYPEIPPVPHRPAAASWPPTWRRPSVASMPTSSCSPCPLTASCDCLTDGARSSYRPAAGQRPARCPE